MTKHPVCFFWLPFQAVKRGNSFGTFDTLHKAPLCERKQSNQFKTEEALNQKECEHKGRERGIVTLHEVHRAEPCCRATRMRRQPVRKHHALTERIQSAGRAAHASIKNHDEWRPTAQQIAKRFAAESGFAAFLRATIFGTFSRKSTKQGNQLALNVPRVRKKRRIAQNQKKKSCTPYDVQQ